MGFVAPTTHTYFVQVSTAMSLTFLFHVGVNCCISRVSAACRVLFYLPSAAAPSRKKE